MNLEKLNNKVEAAIEDAYDESEEYCGTYFDVPAGYIELAIYDDASCEAIVVSNSERNHPNIEAWVRDILQPYAEEFKKAKDAQKRIDYLEGMRTAHAYARRDRARGL